MKENQGIDWQDKVIIGSIVAGGLVITAILIQPQSQLAVLSQKNTSPSTSAQPAPAQSFLAQSEAINIVKGWYNAKPQIFSKPFSRRLVSQYTTGQLYYKTLEESNGGSKGSQGWLKDRGCYYTYNFSEIEKVWLFDNKNKRPVLKIRIYERLQLHGPASQGCSGSLETYRKNVTYWFEKDDGTWKIYDSKISDD